MPAKKILKKKRNFLNNIGGIDKGSVYVVVIIILLIFGGYILTGGVLPTKLPKPNYNLVSLMMPGPQPTTASSLQMQTFSGATLPPNPPPQQPGQPQPTSPYTPTYVDCGYQYRTEQEAPMIWGYIINSTPASANAPALKIFYVNESPLLLGSGTISQMTNHPADHITNPNIGNTGIRDADNLPFFPALFLTDITLTPDSKSGDAQSVGQANRPTDLYGSWKARGAQDPEENNTDLGPGADTWPPANGPAGRHSSNFSSEIIWKLSSLKAIDPATKQYLALLPGHTYRGQIMLHDDQNHIGTMCVTFRMPGGTPAASTTTTQNLNLTNWKLQLPIGSNGSLTEISQPELATYKIDPWFSPMPGQSATRFRAAVNGVTTGGSVYPRSELREMKNNGTTPANWSSAAGTHTLFLDQAITAVPQTKKQVVAGQIFSGDNFLLAVRLEFPKLFIKIINDSNEPTLDANYTLGKRYTLKLEVSRNQTKIYYNGSTTPIYTLNRSYSDAYFKTGAYTQSNCNTESASACNTNNYGEVILYQAAVTHTN